MNVVIIGTGYVGLVTGACLASIGHNVICVDKNISLVRNINQGKIPFYEPGLNELVTNNIKQGRLNVITDLKRAMVGAQLSLIAVGTPCLDEDIDLSFVLAAASEVASYLYLAAKKHSIVLKSTCIPGTTDGDLKNVVETVSGLKANAEFGLAVNPEFLREGSAINDFLFPDRIVIGTHDDECASIVSGLYHSFDCKKIYTTPCNAEMIKYTSNALLANLISFSNEISSICEGVSGLQEHVIMKGVHLDKRFHVNNDTKDEAIDLTKYLRAGIGFGGSCFPKDTMALRKFAEKKNIQTPMLQAAIDINENRANVIISLIEKNIGSLKGKTTVVLGLSFKPDTDDIRCSPGIKLAKILIEKNAIVKCWDPVAISNAREELPSNIEMSDDLSVTLHNADLAIIATPWQQIKEYDWQRASSLMAEAVVFDGRSALTNNVLPDNIYYQTVGEMKPKQIEIANT